MLPEPIRALPAKSRLSRGLDNLSRVRRLIPANDDLTEKAFLPAALELIETPPSPAGRGLIYLLCSLFVIAVAWAYLGKVDLIATASGKIIPSGKVKVIQPLEIGVVSKIDVAEGQAVRKGDLLVEIDPTESRAEAARLKAEWQENEVEVARLSAEAKSDDPGVDAEAFLQKALPGNVDPALATRQLALLHSDLGQQQAVLAGLDSDREQKEAEKAQAETEIAKLKQTLPLIQKRADMRAALIKQGYSSVMDASKDEQALIESQQSLREAQQKRDESIAAIAQLVAQRKEAVSKFMATTLGNLAEDAQKAEDARQQFIKAQDLAEHRQLTAPVDGVVQQLAIHTVGGVVTPAQELMVVVPKGAVLEVEAMIQNKDIGFVREGQPAEIKIEAFPFTRYGLRHGTVLEVSRDAVPPQQSQALNKSNGNSDTTSNGVQTQESPYVARISLDQDAMVIDGRQMPLGPGMTVTAEIKTGRQRILDYLLDPLRRYQHDSFQER